LFNFICNFIIITSFVYFIFFEPVHYDAGIHLFKFHSTKKIFDVMDLTECPGNFYLIELKYPGVQNLIACACH